MKNNFTLTNLQSSFSKRKSLLINENLLQTSAPFFAQLSQPLKRSMLRAFLALCAFLTSFSASAQRLSPQEQLQAICEPGAELEFFVIRKDLNITKEEFIGKYLQILNMVPNSEMRQFRQFTNDIGVTSTFYQQYLNGRKIKGAEMVTNEQRGRLKYVNGRYLQQAPLNENVLVSAETALQTAMSMVQSTDYLWLHPEAEAAFRKFKKDSNASYKPAGELIYVSSSLDMKEIKDYRLVWHYKIHVNPQIQSTEFFIDATTGEIVNKLPLTFDCDAGSSTTLWNGARTLYTQANAGSWRTLGDCNSARIHTYNGNGNDNGVGATYYTDANNTWPSTDLGKYIAQTHWGSKETRDYYAAVHSREGYDDAGADYISYINPGYTGNAYWTGAGTSFGGSSTGVDPYVTLDVSGHEHTHGMIDFTSNLTYSYESGALNESFADCLGEAVEAYALGGTPDWEHRLEINGGNRSFTNPNSKGDPDTYLGDFWWTTAGDNGGVHTNSGVQNRWFYVLSVGHSGTNDNGHTYTVSAIGLNKARLIAYDNMVTLVSSSQYTNSRSNSIQKAKDRYGDCSDEQEQTTHAWRAVGVGAAYVAPTPLTISVTTSATSLCAPGGNVTLTAFGASTYVWSPGGSGNPLIYNLTNTTTFTVTGTNAEDCTGSKVVTVYENKLPTVEPTISDNELCPGQTTTVSASTNQTINNFATQLTGTASSAGNAFDIHAYNNITITDFKMNIASGDSAEVWYNPGGYGNANVTTNTGWTKLGATVPITAAGVGNLTTIPTTVNLTIGAGSTYGIIVICNGNNRYTTGNTVGAIAESNPDLYLTQGHAGTGGFGGTFNMTFSPRIFDGEIVYRTNYTNYAWTPAATVSSPTSSSTSISPTSSTQYTLTATDGNGCTNTGIVKAYVYQNPLVGSVSASPSSICMGGTSQLTNFPFLSSSSQSLFTTVAGGNGSSGNVFDVHAINNITITNVRMNIQSGDSAQVWYKTSPYGNTTVSSSVGWTKLGNTVAITPAGAGALTLIPTTANLVIPAGSTYGIAVVCNGSNDYTNGTTVGAVAYSSPDLEITEGHGGGGFNGAFSFINSPRIFNGQIDYTVTNNPMTHSWTPSGSLSNSSISNPVADPFFNTEYRLILTDVHGCKDTAYKTVYVNRPAILTTTVSPNSICPGDSAQLNVIANVNERDSLETTLLDDNANGGNAFDIITSKAIIVRSFKMNIDTGATQAEVWYKNGGYGNANFSGTAGWTKLGATVTITPAGAGNMTNIPITSSLSIPSGSTYGFMIVSNSGTVNYTNGTTVGAVYKSNPDISITEGHGGTGIGSYSFAAFPRIWNGEVVYDAVNAISGYVWTPNTNMNNASISNPKAAPLSTTIYSVTATDMNGCTSVASAAVVVSPLPTLGTATATPASLCLGSNVSLAYTAPAGLGCYGAIQSGFSGTYTPGNWTLTQSPAAANGTVNTAAAPGSITMTSSNGAVGGGSGTTNYAITVPCNGVISFNWSYTTADGGPQYDYPRYSINGGTGVVLPGYIGQSGASKVQSGVFNLAVTAGQTFALQMVSSDNIGGAATVVFSSFKAPYQTTSGQSVVWFSAPSGGSNLGNGNPQLHTPATTNSFTYYAQVSSSITGCTNTSRAATNLVTVNPNPVVGTSASATTICQGSSTTLTATGAATYSWQPGGLSGASVIVSPVSTTTYTVTGTTAQGCTATATRLITVNPAAAVAGSASPGIVCPGGAVTLIGTNAGATYNWQPGNLTTASGVSVIVNPTTQTTYTVTATYANGCTRTATFVILMHPTPTVTTSVVPVSGTICAGSSATITASGANSYTWQPGGVAGATLIATAANTYTVTGTNAQGCTATATRTITVNSLPSVNINATATTICQGSSTTLTATGATSYSWQPGGMTGASVIVSPASTTTYTVTGTNANGCVNTATRLITVNPAAAVSGSATPSIVCPGSTVTLIGTNAGASYNWQPGNLNSASGVGIVVNPIAQTTYTVTATYGNGCTRTATFVILMHPTPTVTTSVSPVSGTICAGSSATITASGASSYTWQPGGSVGATFIATLANTYTVTGTNAQGCTATATRVITVNSLPSVGTTATANTICSGTSTSLTGTGAISYVWNPGALSGTTIIVSPITTTTYTVIGTNANGCTNTATRTITVNTSPPVGSTATLTTIPCGGSSTITATGASTYTWSHGLGSGASKVVSPTATTTYTITGTAANGCTATTTRTITVNPGCGTTVNIKLYIEGYYLGGGMMQAVLLNQAVAGASPTVTDSITVELRSNASPGVVAATQKVVLNTNGTVVCNFNITGSYYLVIKHRNALQTWSALPLTISGGTVNYDFSNLASKAYGSNQVNLEPGVFGLYSGDIFVDENIDLSDLSVQEADINLFLFGYYATDVNGDGNVDILDSPVVETNVNNFIFSLHP